MQELQRVAARCTAGLPPFPLWVTVASSKALGLFPATYGGGRFRVARRGGRGALVTVANLAVAVGLALFMASYDASYVGRLNVRSGRVAAGFAVVAIHALLVGCVVACLGLSLRRARAVAATFTLAEHLLRASARLLTYRRLDRRAITNLVGYLLVVASFVPHSVALGLYASEPGKFTMALVPLVIGLYVWMVAVPFTAESQFVTLCFVTERTLKAVNAALRALAAPRARPGDAWANAWAGAWAGAQPLLRLKELRWAGDAWPLPAEVRALRDLTAQALRLAGRANRDFGPLNLLNSLVCQCNLVLHLYVAVSYALDGGASASSDAHALYMVLHSAHLFLRLWFVGLRCDAIVSEVSRTERLLTALDQEALAPRVRDELQAFRNELAASKVEFSACGYFRLNLEQVSNMVATTTTYIVILIQFQRT